MPQPRASFQDPKRVRCPKCQKPLKAASTYRMDGDLLTCTNKVRQPGVDVGGPTVECSAKIYLLIGRGFAVTAILSPDEFRELRSRPDSGDPMKILEWLGLASVPLMPAA